ncbi:hypothetical protein [Legionella micdadei]|uniref:Uncharacterized protein n=1 Tax=Legionella micdadei TaxID=451 RepID=A0A098GK23_LEGMI|nr:hypothetical protein [Legionella micdadei]ARG96760.1 hypothetical protein B6N58_03255 [Legionella micdadei]KTD26429.1 hypothetical protein Lmic_2523 [Legionella micdadei]NSL17979.1 hypothetical protein [Legionella micdadei]CEG61856.1 protein of unknown function [Legionella micdadei]SCY25602.1 hypothetical protein SAMN02982997_01229 [Legionella micdadei]
MGVRDLVARMKLAGSLVPASVFDEGTLEIQERQGDSPGSLNFSEKVEYKEFTYNCKGNQAGGDIFSNYLKYAELAGLEFLYEDVQFLQSKLREILNQYTKCWLDAMSHEEKSFRKQNKGRFAANTFIREIMEDDD